jgi:RNAse (barnase) inhibitor barstar
MSDFVPTKRVYEIDGAKFSSLEQFFDEISTKLVPGFYWGRNLDAFNDILRGGFGTPEGGFILRWKNSQISRERLGFAETVRQLEHSLEYHRNRSRTAVAEWERRASAKNLPALAEKLRHAKAQLGKTVFDWLVDIILDHCPGGTEQENGVELELA